MNGDKGPEIGLVTGAILKASFEVMNELGHGFQEAIYQRALSFELSGAGLAVEREAQFPVLYKGPSPSRAMPELYARQQS